MSYEYYYAGGFCHHPSKEDPRRGMPETIFYNPTTTPSEAVMRLFFTDREPVTLDPVYIKPETNNRIVFPDAKPELLTNCGFFGAKIQSNTPLLVNYANSGYQVMHDPQHFAGGGVNFHATKLHQEWHFPDGLWLEWYKELNGRIEQAPFPFNENEHYYFLNPHKEEVDIEMLLRFHERGDMKFHFTVKPERLLVWENIDLVPYNCGYTIKITVTKPITCSSIRFIYGLRGFHEWGMNIHVAQWAVPGPIIA